MLKNLTPAFKDEVYEFNEVLAFDAVNVFNDVRSAPLSETNPKDVICADELTIPLGTEVMSVKSTEPLDVK